MKKTPSRTGGVQTTKRKQTNCTAGNKAKISLDRLMINECPNLIVSIPTRLDDRE
jgi:hypothetical protein